jgi:hypothetical protein
MRCRIDVTGGSVRVPDGALVGADGIEPPTFAL